MSLAADKSVFCFEIVFINAWNCSFSLNWNLILVRWTVERKTWLIIVVINQAVGSPDWKRNVSKDANPNNSASYVIPFL